ncbi:hypothetical protein [Phreatobacter stygius]|uniref:Uncharacterized protein n=1 Tax=Phreatobacter stygius TaxID=1940610 RepID=A0A4D7BG47_9HYPH|nr:hypothetical protein [Phreatobacter stygius]QCI68146.1 hypothetical protein E8M01_30290 [Phreatobacter stygius]
MRPVVLALGFALLPAMAFAQTAPGAPRDADAGRFTLRETPDGLLRLDGRTGQISLCNRQDGAFTCRLVADDRAALQAEIDRLKAENDALKRGGASALSRPGTDGQGLNLPSDQEVDRALSLAERIWRRFMGIMRETEQDQGRRL